MNDTGSTDRAALDLTGPADRRPSPETLRDLLREVIDPEVGINVVDLGLLYNIRLSEGTAAIRMTLTTPGCPLGGYLTDAIHDALQDVPGVTGVDVQIVWEPPWDPDQMMSDWAKDQLGWNR